MLLFFSLFEVAASQYAIVVDAGSTKTILHIYVMNFPSIFHYDSKQSEKVLYNVLLSNDVVKDIFRSHDFTTLIEENIPSSDRKSCTVTIMASCLRQFPQEQVERIFNITDKFLKQDDLWKQFSYDNRTYQVLSSPQEALLSWISVNDQKQLLGEGKTPKAVSTLSSSAVTIVYPESSKTNDGYHAKITLRGKEYTLYVAGFDGYGINSAIQNSSLTIASKEGKSTIDSPCFLAESAEPFVLYPNGNDDSHRRYPLLKIHGKDPSLKQCSDTFNTLLNTSICSSNKCYLEGAPFLGSSGDLYLTGAFYYPKKIL